ncbi:MAG: DUF3597 domain-containing protein [Gallionella sp.]|nr:DUF3597 domain-containing protein [Gallionella sp.]
MGFFSNILSKLGFPTDEAAPASAPIAAASSAVPVVTAEPVSRAIPEVDVVAKLTVLAANSPEKLNWTVSIVDLLKLPGLDSSLAARKELAMEIGCPADYIGDSAKMNMWLHKNVLKKLAENGGNIPPELLN